MAEIYFSGQGIVYASVRDTNGNVTAFRDLGNVPALKLSLKTDVIQHKESRTGQRLEDNRLTKDKMAEVTITLESFNKQNLMMLLYGTSTSITTASITNETFPTVAVGDVVSLAHVLVKSSPTPTIKNSAGSTTLVSGTDYILDPVAGMVTMLSTAVTSQPYKANYDYDNADVVQIFKQPAQERFLRFVGLNTANSSKQIIVELYRVVFDPSSSLELINDDYNKFELNGSLLYDSSRDTSSPTTLGGFGRIVQL